MAHLFCQHRNTTHERAANAKNMNMHTGLPDFRKLKP
jgi:hypothetical protein